MTRSRDMRIICEEQHGQWSVWFEKLPQVAAGGEVSSDAMSKLLDLAGAMFDGTEISTSDPDTRDGHLEFLIQLRELLTMPRPSVN